MKYNITRDMIPKDLVKDWLNDSVSGDWSEFIARRLNAAIKMGVVVPTAQFNDAVEQDYCTLCGNILKTLPVIKCQDCIHAVISEDRSDDMRPPFCHCKKDHDVIVLGVMHWQPESGYCSDYVEGESAYY